MNIINIDACATYTNSHIPFDNIRIPHSLEVAGKMGDYISSIIDGNETETDSISNDLRKVSKKLQESYNDSDSHYVSFFPYFCELYTIKTKLIDDEHFNMPPEECFQWYRNLCLCDTVLTGAFGLYHDLSYRLKLNDEDKDLVADSLKSLNIEYKDDISLGKYVEHIFAESGESSNWVDSLLAICDQWETIEYCVYAKRMIFFNRSLILDNSIRTFTSHIDAIFNAKYYFDDIYNVMYMNTVKLILNHGSQKREIEILKKYPIDIPSIVNNKGYYDGLQLADICINAEGKNMNKLYDSFIKLSRKTNNGSVKRIALLNVMVLASRKDDNKTFNDTYERLVEEDKKKGVETPPIDIHGIKGSNLNSLFRYFITVPFDCKYKPFYRLPDENTLCI